MTCRRRPAAGMKMQIPKPEEIAGMIAQVDLQPGATSDVVTIGGRTTQAFPSEKRQRHMEARSGDIWPGSPDGDDDADARHDAQADGGQHQPGCGWTWRPVNTTQSMKCRRQFRRGMPQIPGQPGNPNVAGNTPPPARAAATTAGAAETAGAGCDQQSGEPARGASRNY